MNDPKTKIEYSPWISRCFCINCDEQENIFIRFPDPTTCRGCGHYEKGGDVYSVIKVLRYKTSYVKKGLIFKRWVKYSEVIEYKEDK